MSRYVTISALAALAIGGCAVGQSVSGGVSTVRSGLGDAVAAPLEDFNLTRDEIPTVLLQAQANPYDLRGLTQCGGLSAEIGRLNEALGPDLDEQTADGRLASERAADAAADATLDAVRGAATDLIPGRSWIRRLSGAEQHSRQVQAALQAGIARRAFLKGVGLQRNCAPPAAPAWFRPR